MANTIEMVVSLSEDDRKRLDAILVALWAMSPPPQNAEIKAETPDIPEIVQTTEKTAPEAPQSYTTKDVQQKVLELTTQKGVAKAAVREIVKAYADKVQNIPEDKLGEVMQKLIALEG